MMRLGDAEGKRSDVAPDEVDVAVQSGSPDTAAGLGEHRRRAIDPDETDARTADRNRDAAGAAAKLQHRAGGTRGKVPPEGHVAAAERSCVLPVVERRVVVPAFVAFTH